MAFVFEGSGQPANSDLYASYPYVGGAGTKDCVGEATRGVIKHGLKKNQIWMVCMATAKVVDKGAEGTFKMGATEGNSPGLGTCSLAWT